MFLFKRPSHKCASAKSYNSESARKPTENTMFNLSVIGLQCDSTYLVFWYEEGHGQRKWFSPQHSTQWIMVHMAVSAYEELFRVDSHQFQFFCQPPCNFVTFCPLFHGSLFVNRLQGICWINTSKIGNKTWQLQHTHTHTIRTAQMHTQHLRNQSKHLNNPLQAVVLEMGGGGGIQMTEGNRAAIQASEK